jgi:phosphoribosyl 1,2-cyclic phosphodiesterase
MKVSIKGTRGSVPTTDPRTSRYGGNTSCVTVAQDGQMLILDGGTGIQKVQLPDGFAGRVDILLTHLHLDHIQGLGFFKPLFESDLEVHLWAPSSSTDSLHTRLGRYLSPPLFPVLLRDLPCKLELHEIANSQFSIGPFRISSRFVIHTGPTVGYRIDGPNASLAYIPDHEPALGRRGIIPNPKWISGFDLAEEVDLLLHDGHYTADEYPNKKGWGHSSMEDALEFASLANVKRLMLTHHDPARTDDQLDELHSALEKTLGGRLMFEFAREGNDIQLGA